jgi:citrate synthase
MADTGGRNQGRSDETDGWWSTALVTSTSDGMWFRGAPVEDVIGTFSVADLIWFLVMGTPPEPARSRLLDAFIVAAADFGPRAPSIAVARMAATCGLDFNGIVSSAVGMLGDIHGGAVEQAGEVIAEVAEADDIPAAAAAVVAEARAAGRHLPGFGHRHLEHDPRSQRLLDLVAEEHAQLDGRFAAAASAIQSELSRVLGRPMPMNIDGGGAVALLEIGLPVTVFRGILCLSRTIGIIAEAHEELQQGGRLKGPSHPRDGSVRYVGPEPGSVGVRRDPEQRGAR